MKVVRI